MTLAAFRSAVLDVKVYNHLAKSLPIKAVTTEYGIKITLPEVLFIDKMPIGDFYTFEFQLDKNQWSDSNKFPCKLSQLEPSFPSCDYYLHGWQTKLGDARVQLEDATGGCSCHAHCLEDGVANEQTTMVRALHAPTHLQHTPPVTLACRHADSWLLP